jgi:hypothetical protein
MSQLAASEGQPRVNGGGAGFFLRRLETVRPQAENAGRSGMTGDCHVSICGGVGVRFPCATRHSSSQIIRLLTSTPSNCLEFQKKMFYDFFNLLFLRNKY